MKKKLFNKKSQLSPFYLTIIATILILAMVLINIGKIVKDKTYTANSADSGAISSASVMAYAFNYVAEANKSDKDKRLEKNYNNFKQAMDHYFQKADQYKQESDQRSQKTRSHTCSECGGYKAVIDDADKTKKKIGKKGSGGGKGAGYIGQIYDMIKQNEQADQANADDKQKGSDVGAIPNYSHLQWAYYKAIRERVHDDSKNGKDLYQTALSAGCKYNMFNSGFPTKMGEDSKMFFEFVDQECSPENISNGSAVTFTWSDKAGRSHTVSSMISIDAVHTYDLTTTAMDRPQVKQLLDLSMQLGEWARDIAIEAMAKTAYQSAIDTCTSTSCCYCWVGFCIWCCGPIVCEPLDATGDAAMQFADMLMNMAKQMHDMAKQGLNNDGSFTSGNKDDVKDKIIKYITDIQHSRSVSSQQFQKHQGGVIKSPRETPDTPTFYPPVQSCATASFRGQGSIHPAKPSHDSSLGQ